MWIVKEQIMECELRRTRDEYIPRIMEIIKQAQDYFNAKISC
ncbi:MAG: hypothetical protein RR844_02645 [Clostridium sp.]